jgi:TPP-dependent pyruvate/acetoin dehydrogenase alpha subunit
MASRRIVKKNINTLIGDVIEEYYNSLLNDEVKSEEQVEKMVDECVDLADELIAKVNSAKKLKSRAEVKKLFAEVKDKLGDNVLGYIEKLDNL